jgi:hypothetical protein
MQNRTVWTIVIVLVVLALLACCCIGLFVPAAFGMFRTTTRMSTFPGIPDVSLMPGVTTVTGTGRIVEREFPLGNVNRVHLTGSADLVIRQGTETSIQIQAEENVIDLIQWEERNGSITISMRPNVRIIRSGPILVTLTVRNLVAVTSAGSGDIDASDMMGDTVSIQVIGSGDVSVGYVEAQTMDITSSGSGDIRLLGLTADEVRVNMMGSGSVWPGDGMVDRQELTIAGSGSYRAEALESARVTANLMGSGSARIRVSEELSGRLVGSGDLEYIGSPTLSTSAVGSGRIRQVGP